MSYKDQYSKRSGLYDRLVRQMIARYKKITLPEEYGYFIQENLMQFLVRVSRFKFAAKMLNKNDRTLEIGCGSGLGTNFLAQFCQHVTGLDVKAEEIENAKAITRRKNISFERSDFFNLPSSRRFDTIVALDVIEHMAKAQGDRLLAKAAKHLRPSGLLIIGTPSKYVAKYQGPLSKASHIKLYDQDELRSLVEKHFQRTVAFSMNDEVVHTGHAKMAWYYFVLAFGPKGRNS